MSNQKEYPQHGNQKTGAGFPILRLVAVMSLTLGTMIDYAIGAYKGKGTGEQSLFSEISDSINKNDIVLADKYFPSFFLWPK
jgi:membrane protein YqaA with SNARE-associated domain